MRPLLVACILMAVPLSGCALENGDLWAPDRLTVTSPTIQNEGEFPQQHACDGADRSPGLSVGDLPPGTQTVAVVLKDVSGNAPSVGWVMWNVPTGPTYVDIPEDRTPHQADVGTNSEGTMAYAGPCPPAGQEHTYRFTVYAVDRALNLDSGSTWDALEEHLQGRVIAQGHLSATYAR